ncbi:MAG: hypothetical protein Q8Q23_00545 [bacterium]|nr:hypothetical protein [bacterium]
MEKLIKIFGSIVETFFVTQNGASLSEVNRVQAENKQQNDSFWSLMSDAVGGVFTKEVSFVGAGDSTPRDLAGAVISTDQIGEYAGVAWRNAQTAILMHALKLWKRLQAELQEMDLRHFVADSLPEAPVRPQPAQRGSACSTEDFMELANIDEIIANLKSDVLAQFEFAFWKRTNELNSRAAVLGKLLSEQNSFFRALVKSLPKGSEQPTQNGVIITRWKKAYSDSQLATFASQRDELQAVYNDLQQQLNGRKKQIKDALRAYNLAEERRYQTDLGIYQLAAEAHARETERIRSAAETLRQEALQELAGLQVRT